MIIELEKFKLLKGIADGKNDAQITALIAVVEDDFVSIRNKEFETDNKGNVVYPKGSESIAFDMINYRLSCISHTGVSAETIGSYSISYDTQSFNGYYPQAIIKRIKRFIGAK